MAKVRVSNKKETPKKQGALVPKKQGVSKQRKRGRPPGKPKKLDEKQRRDRNAELERERRAEINEAYDTLQSFCSEHISGTSVALMTRPQLLEAVTTYISNKIPLDVYRSEMNDMEQEIKELEAKLAE